MARESGQEGAGVREFPLEVGAFLVVALEVLGAF